MIVPERPEDGIEPLLHGLRRRRFLAWIVLAFEQVWPAIWPALGIAGLSLCVALLDVLPALPAWGHAACLALAGLAFAGLLLRGLLRIEWPDAWAADRRLEQASGLSHRPLQVLTDRPALLGAEAIWQAHLKRAMAQVTRLRVGLPHPGLAGIDRRALRGGLVVALVACIGIAGPAAPDRVARALMPGFAPDAAPAAALLQAWITPPAYTAQAPVFLKPEGGAATIPAGSHLTLSLSGGRGVPALALGGRQVKLQQLDSNSFQADLDLTDGGRLALTRDHRDVAGWELAVVADQPPSVSFPEAPSVIRGRLPQTRVPWQVSHTYGVAGLVLELRLRDRKDSPTTTLAVPLPSASPKSARGARLLDLTPHPWAGLAVVGQLVGRSVSGREGRSSEVTFELPERSFLHPVARALMEIRRGLSLNPEDRTSAIVGLDRLARLDEFWDTDHGAYLALRDSLELLRQEHDVDAHIAESQQQMWQLALHLEEGAPERTAKALEDAREKLRQAMEAEKRGEKLEKGEIDKRMRDLQEALRKHLDALAEQAQRDPDSRAYDPREHELDVRDMQRLTEDMRDAARREQMDAARDKMAELDKMLDEMKNARNERGKMTEREKQRAEQRQKGQGQVSVLQDVIQREGGLLDHAQARADAAAPQSTPRLGPALRRPDSPAASPERLAADRDGEQSVQRALRRVLGEVMQQYGDLMGEVPTTLGEADGAMRDATTALAQAQDPAAAGLEQKAIEALQKSGRQMAQQMAQKFGSGQEGDQGGDMDGEGQDGQQGDMAGNQDGQGDGDGMFPNQGRGRGRNWNGQGASPDRRADNRRDPLGRILRDGNAGTDESSDVKVPDEMEQARTRAIQDELRRRSAERDRPQPELEYLDRLLRQY